jgi:GNAT superfamily N-acetyltransferase
MSDTEQKWSIRPYRDGDEDGILELWKAVYPEHTYDREQWMKWWQWMYRANPNGMGVIFLAEQEGRIIGHTAEIPVMMKIGSGSVLVGISLDAMTHPDYRRQGTFVALVKARSVESEKRGIRATYGFRNKFSYPYPALADKVGMFDGATMQKVLRPLDWKNALRTQTQNRFLLTIGSATGGLLSTVFFRARNKPLSKGLTVAQEPHFDDRINDLWRRVSSQYQAIVSRNMEYLNWRYVAVPHRDYSIYLASRSETVAGYLVVGRREADSARIAIIVDVLAESEEVAECLISKAVEHCRLDKRDLIWSARIAGTSLARAYRRNGFVSVPFAKSIGIKGRSSSPSIARQMQNPKNWFLQMGDSDEA